MPALAGFIGPAYQSESLAVNAQRCVNWYLEQDPTGKQPNVFYGAPGLRLLGTAGPGPIRAQETCSDSIIVVSGNGIYRVQGHYVATLLLAINENDKPVFIAQAGSNALIVDGDAGYWVDWTNGTWTAGIVTSPDFPVSPATCTALDGYFITHTAGTKSFQISSPFNAQIWDAADVAAKEGQNDPLVRVIASYRELYLVGERTSEVWQDAGTADFPFVRIDGAFIEQGALAAATVRDIDGAIIWLGGSKVGKNIVWRMSGFQPIRITTHAQEGIFGAYTTSDAYAWVYQDKGHAFYALNFPTDKATWCFDITTQLWHERLYRNPETALFEHHRGTCHTLFNGVHVVGDRLNGNLYALDRTIYSDNGDPLVALRTAPHTWNLGERGMLSELEFFFEPGVGLNDGQGVDPQAMLRISKNGGRTFPIARMTSIGKMGEYTRRARFVKIANTRDFVIELSISDPVKRVLIGAVARIS